MKTDPSALGMSNPQCGVLVYSDRMPNRPSPGTLLGLLISEFLPEITSFLSLRKILVCEPVQGLDLRPFQ